VHAVPEIHGPVWSNNQQLLITALCTVNGLCTVRGKHHAQSLSTCLSVLCVVILNGRSMYMSAHIRVL